MTRTHIKSLLLMATLICSSAAAKELKPSPPRTMDLKPVRVTAVIQSGDSLPSFLNRHGVTRDEILLLNPEIQLSELKVGMELQLPTNPSKNLSSKEQLILDRMEAEEETSCDTSF